MTEVTNDVVRALLRRYEDDGFSPMFYRRRTKGPEGADAVDWQSRTYRFEEYRDGDNIGLKTGTVLRSGRRPVDFDCDHPLMAAFAQPFMRRTDFGFGRDSKPLSHGFYEVDEPFASRQYQDIDGTMLSELRCAKEDGSVGFQTMVSYSEHPSGELVRPIGNTLGDRGYYDVLDTLFRHAALTNTAALLFLHIGQRQLLHDLRLALAGFLLKDVGLTKDEAIAVGQSIARQSGNDVNDVEKTVETTLQRIANTDRITRLGALARGIGTENDRRKQVVGRVLDFFNTSDFTLDQKRRPAYTQDNIALALRKLSVSVSFDDFAQKPQVSYRGYTGLLNDSITRRIWFDSQRELQFHPPRETWFDAVLDLAERNDYHPVLDYLNDLKWDGTPRVDEWLIKSAKAADNEYVRAVSALVLIAAVRRVRKPGAKFDEMLVLESGEQGKFKSSALRALCPREEWFSDDLPLSSDSKEIIERSSGKWLIEASDLSGMRASKVEALKASLSRQTDGPVRLAYGRFGTEVARQFIIIGTTNSYAYLADTTGNRRFWPVRVERFDLEWIRANRDQLWAEAAHREAQGEPIRLDPKLWPLAALQQERRRITDAWEETLSKHYDGPYHRLTPDEIWERLNIPIERRDGRAQKRVTEVMQILGFRRAPVRDPELKGPDGRGKVVKGWAKGTQEDVNAEQRGQLDLPDEAEDGSPVTR